jgi:HK97 family phage major capsid protein
MSNIDVAKGLVEERQKAWHEAKEILEKPGSENREFSPDDQQKLDTINKHLDTLDARIKDLVDGEKRSQETSKAYEELAAKSVERGGSASSPANAQFMEELRAFHDFDGHPGKKTLLVGEDNKGTGTFSKGDSAMLRELRRGPVSPYMADNIIRAQDEKRELIAGTGGAQSVSSPYSGGQGAGGLVPIDFYDRLIAYLIQVSGIMQTGPTVIHSPGGAPIQIPYVSAHPSAGVSAEGAQIVSGDPSFAQKELYSYKFGWFGQVTRELIDDTAVDLLGYLAMSAGRAVGNSLGAALMTGTTSGVTQPLLSGAGGVTTSVTGTTTGVAGAPQYKDLVSLQYSVIAPYRQSRSCYWLAADATIGGFRLIVDGNNRPVWEPSAVLGSPDLLLGKPLVADPYVPATALSGASVPQSVVFGDFSQFIVRLIGGVRFERSDDYAFNQDLVSFRALIRADGALADKNALGAYVSHATS